MLTRRAVLYTVPAAIAADRAAARQPVSVRLEEVYDPGTPGKPTLAEGGFVFSWRISPGRDRAWFLAHRLDGKFVARLDPAVPDADQWFATAAMADGAGGFVLSGLCWRAGKRSSWLIFTDETGALRRQVKVTPWNLGRLARAADGGIWGFGCHLSDAAATSNQPVLHSFDEAGRLRSSFLPRRSFPEALPPDYSDPVGGESMLHANGELVSIYAAPGRRLVQVQSGGQVVRHSVLPPPDGAGARLTSLAVTRQNLVFATASSAEGGVLLRLAEPHRLAWERVSGLSTDPGILCGSDEEGLVLLRREGQQRQVDRLRLAELGVSA